MRNQFVRMQPNADNMVLQPGPYASVDILCVECGWEGVAFAPSSPKAAFLQHACRLTSQMVSTSD